MKKLLFLLFACVPFLLSVSAQSLQINGYIVIDEAGTEGAKLIVFKNSKQIEEQIIAKKGKFDLKLALDNDYRLSFEKQGYVTKTVTINTEVPEEIIISNPDFPPVKLIINLLPHVDGVDISIFEQPIAILAYNYELDDFTFDKEYTAKIKDRVAQTEQEIRRAISNRGAESLEKERMFASLVTKGQEGFDQKKWQEAIDNWTKALAIKPENKELKERITIAQKENELELAQKTIEAQNAKAYKLLITSADSLFNLKKYMPAKEKYTIAVPLAKDNYPSLKIKEIETLLAQIAEAEKNAALQQTLIQNYNLLIAEADKAFTQKSYNQAEIKYKEALALNYQKEYPQQQLQAIASIQKQEAERLKQETDLATRYTKIIASADNLFNTQVYEECILTYRQALELKPSETYPKEMIAKAEQSMTLLKQQQEAEAEKKRQEELRKAEAMNEYNRIIAEADAAFKNENYAIARTRYMNADQLNTGEVYPKNKIKEIDTIFNSAKYQQRLAEYKKNKDIGDKEAAAKNYASARFYYQKALAILPIDKDTIEASIAEIEKLIEAERLATQTKEYNEHIGKADNAYREKSYAIAKFYYQKALDVKKGDEYAQKQLNEIEKYISERSEKTMEL